MAKKSAPKTPTKPARKPRKTERQLRVKFTDIELLEKGRGLAEKHGERGRIEGEFDSVKAQFKSKLERIDSEIGETAGHLQAGWEYRKVACEITFDDPKPGQKTTRRLDSNETIEVEAMSMEELQDELPLTPGAPVAGIDSGGNVAVTADKGGEAGHDEGKRA